MEGMYQTLIEMQWLLQKTSSYNDDDKTWWDGKGVSREDGEMDLSTQV